VWGFDAGSSSNSLEVYVGYLRRKLEAGGEPRILQTVRGFGYVLRADDGRSGRGRADDGRSGEGRPDDEHTPRPPTRNAG
jgi:DNA-binding winged helix-turn-helix (wHTH) protein